MGIRFQGFGFWSLSKLLGLRGFRVFGHSKMFEPLPSGQSAFGLFQADWEGSRL